MRSKFWWFTELCNSHYVSQFAAFFIDTRAERSTVESRRFISYLQVKERGWRKLPFNTPIPFTSDLTFRMNGFLVCGLGFWGYLSLKVKRKRAFYSLTKLLTWIEGNLFHVHSRFCFVWGMHVNDPSAGSPTETLLRLLLPLSDKVYLTSRILADSVQKVHRTTRNR